jgi:hypothetical protein
MIRHHKRHLKSVRLEKKNNHVGDKIGGTGLLLLGIMSQMSGTCNGPHNSHARARESWRVIEGRFGFF